MRNARSEVKHAIDPQSGYRSLVASLLSETANFISLTAENNKGHVCKLV